MNATFHMIIIRFELNCFFPISSHFDVYLVLTNLSVETALKKARHRFAEYFDACVGFTPIVFYRRLRKKREAEQINLVFGANAWNKKKPKLVLPVGYLFWSLILVLQIFGRNNFILQHSECFLTSRESSSHSDC